MDGWKVLTAVFVMDVEVKSVLTVLDRKKIEPYMQCSALHCIALHCSVVYLLHLLHISVHGNLFLST